MRARAVLLFLGLAFALPAGSASAEVDPEGAKFIQKVNNAIDEGLMFMLGEQAEDGSWPGYEDQYPMGMTSLGLLTILKCGYPRNSEVVKKTLKLLYERYKEQRGDRLKTYSVAILMMALEEAWAPIVEQRRRRADRYGTPRRHRNVNLPAFEHKWMRELAEWMVNRRNGAVWRYPRGGFDLSNTQYALLGLSAALRCGIKIPRDVFVKAAERLMELQEKDGPEVRRIVHVDAGPGYARRYLTNQYDHARGWGYQPGERATGSMTTAGVSSLAICRSELLGWSGYDGPFGERMERAIRDGLAWLTKNFSVRRNPGRGGWHYYYLFGLERAGVLTDVDFLGDHDWYREGADYLVDRQRPDGSWPSSGRDRLSNTCFALLFLRRATVPVRVPRATTPAEDGD